MKTQRLNLMIAPEEKAAISRRADALGLSTSELVRRAVAAYDPSDDEAELRTLAEELHVSVERAEKVLDRTMERLERMEETLEQGRHEAREAALKEGRPWPFPLAAAAREAAR